LRANPAILAGVHPPPTGPDLLSDPVPHSGGRYRAKVEGLTLSAQRSDVSKRNVSNGPVPKRTVPNRDSSNRIVDLHTLGRDLLEQGSYADAARALKRRLRLAPGDREARYMLGIADLGLGRTEQAMACFAQVVAEHAEDELATLAKARLADTPAYPVQGSQAL
jgi:tetratricopeptide (TPR) repeat protein